MSQELAEAAELRRNDLNLLLFKLDRENHLFTTKRHTEALLSCEVLIA